MEPDQKQEFERQLEKVVDVMLVFDPNPQEAAAIALSGNTELEEMLRNGRLCWASSSWRNAAGNYYIAQSTPPDIIGGGRLS